MKLSRIFAVANQLMNRLKFHLFKWFRPVMVGKYKRTDGTRLPRTRVSNTTVIQGEKGLNIADNVFIGHFNFIDAGNGLYIETGCQITNYVSILTHSSHKAIRLYGAKYGQVGPMKAYGEGKVFIGKYTFVGPHSVIMPGTTIRKGSLVSAFSMVKGEFPEFSIIAGNPAKVVGDTREMDKQYLKEHPELKDYYYEWAKD